MNRKYILNDTTSSAQTIGIIMPVAFCFFFLSFLFLGWNEGSIILSIASLIFSIPINIYLKRFSEVYTDGSMFFVKSIYRKEQKIDAALFDRIVEVRSIFKTYRRLYYTIYFKNGMKYHFMKTTDTFWEPPVGHEEDLGKQLTKEVRDFVNVNP
jgi:hypothetical protein